MTKVLKTSGFLGLAVMMFVGLHQFVQLAGGQAPPGWMVGGHAHLGVLSILAIVVGFAVSALGVTDRLRATVSTLFVAGQWGLPLTIWIGEGSGLSFLMPTAFLWGTCLIAAMLVMAWKSATVEEAAAAGAPGPAPADD